MAINLTDTEWTELRNTMIAQTRKHFGSTLEEAEDTTQDAILIVLNKESLGQIPTGVRNIRAYFITAAYNRAVNKWKKANRPGRQTVSLQEFLTVEPGVETDRITPPALITQGPEDKHIAEEENAAKQAALASLPFTYAMMRQNLQCYYKGKARAQYEESF